MMGLKPWRDYFSRGRIVGFDTTHVHIDDASHMGHLTRTSFWHVFSTA
jgi:hypothetical protein